MCATVLPEANGGKWVLKTFGFLNSKNNYRTEANGNRQLHFSSVSRAYKRNIQSARRLFGATNPVALMLKAPRDKGFRSVLGKWVLWTFTFVHLREPTSCKGNAGRKLCVPR